MCVRDGSDSASSWQYKFLTCSVATKRCLPAPANNETVPPAASVSATATASPGPAPESMAHGQPAPHLSVSENPAELFDEIPLPSAPSQPTGAAAEMAPDSPAIIYRAVFGMRDASDPSGMLRMVYYKVTHLVLLFLIASSAI